MAPIHSTRMLEREARKPVGEVGLPEIRSIRESLRGGRIGTLKKLLACTPDGTLIGLWPMLAPLEKAAVFKLLPRRRAFRFFEQLPFDDRSLMIQAAPQGCIAPLLETAPSGSRALFHGLTREDVDSLVRSTLRWEKRFSRPAP